MDMREQDLLNCTTSSIEVIWNVRVNVTCVVMSRSGLPFYRQTNGACRELSAMQKDVLFKTPPVNSVDLSSLHA